MCHSPQGVTFSMTGKREPHTFYCHPELVSGSLYVILSASQGLWILNVSQPAGCDLQDDSIESWDWPWE